MNDQIILTSYFLDEPVPAFDSLRKPGWRYISADLPSGNQQERLAPLHQALATEVAAAVAEGRRPVSLAGDCCSAVAVLAGLQRAELAPTLLWLDAHGDFNTWETTPSNFLGGMPLAMAVGLGEQTLLEQVGLSPWPEEKVILADGRDLDPGERELLAASNIRLVGNLEALQRPGVIPDGPLYVHYDTDIVDAADAPAMNYPTSGGPAAGEVEQLFQFLAENHEIVAVSVSLWAPRLDTHGETAQVILKTLEALTGSNWNS